MHDVTLRRRFAAWHRLTNREEAPREYHRHRWEVRVKILTPELGPAGFGLDFELLDRWLAEILGELDGCTLNDLEPFTRVSPSAEHVAEWVFRALTPRLAGKPARLARVEVFEGPRFSAGYEERELAGSAGPVVGDERGESR